MQIDRAKFFSEEYFFNCAILRYNGKLILAYRRDIQKQLPKVYIAELGEDLVPYSNTEIKIPFTCPDGNRHEDPRLFVFKGKLYMGFATVHGQYGVASQGLVQLDASYKVKKVWYPNYKNNRSVAIKGDVIREVAMGVFQTSEAPRDIEKNWIYFEYNDKLYFVYWFNPHQIVEMSLRTGDAKLKYQSRFDIGDRWKFGEIRGGTCPVKKGNYFYSFFHSSLFMDDKDGKRVHMYYAGAYKFEAKPPFKVVAMTNTPLFQGDIDVNLNSWGALCVFPCGSILENSKWTVSYGYHDRECRIFTVKESELEKRLISV